MDGYVTHFFTNLQEIDDDKTLIAALALRLGLCILEDAPQLFIFVFVASKLHCELSPVSILQLTTTAMSILIKMPMGMMALVADDNDGRRQACLIDGRFPLGCLLSVVRNEEGIGADFVGRSGTCTKIYGSGSVKLKFDDSEERIFYVRNLAWAEVTREPKKAFK